MNLAELKFDELQEVNGGGKAETCVAGIVAAGFVPASVVAGYFSGGLSWGAVPVVSGIAYDRLKECLSK